MAANPQSICYPSEANAAGNPTPITKKPFCTKCNAENPHTKPSCCTSSGSRNTANETDPCVVYCNAECNTVCNSSQSYCSIGHQLINSHGDVGAHPGIACVAKDEFIFRNWTADYWNSLGKKLDTAGIVGWTQANGVAGGNVGVVPDPENHPHPAGSLVIADIYNIIIQKLSSFSVGANSVHGAAEVGCETADVIRGGHALALVAGYNGALFNGSVCDQCNTGFQSNPTCSCNCDCYCACNCGCSCPCQCDCSCSCSCGGPG